MNRFRRDSLETRLRDERPQPTDEFVRRISNDTRPQSTGQRRRRLGLAFALSMIVVLAVALTGGIGYASSTASSGASALKHLIAKPDGANRSGTGQTSQSSASAQYEDDVLICHIPNGHVRDRYTILVRRSEVDEHLDHGDYLGACRTEEPKQDGRLMTQEPKHEEPQQAEPQIQVTKKAKATKVAICHISSKRKARTMWVWRGAVASHVKHGDHRGKCTSKSATVKKN